MEGEYGITAGHTPIVSQLKPGMVSIVHKTGEEAESHRAPRRAGHENMKSPQARSIAHQAAELPHAQTSDQTAKRI